ELEGHSDGRFHVRHGRQQHAVACRGARTIMAQVRRPVIFRMRGWFAAVASFALGAAMLAIPAAAFDDEYYEEDEAPLAQPLADERVLPVPRVTIYPGDIITE